MAEKVKTKRKSKSSDQAESEMMAALDGMSAEEIRAYLEKREGGVSVSSSSNGARTAGEKAQGGFSVIRTMAGKTVFIIGGTGFLGRMMVYYLLKFVPDIKHIYVLVRPTHGQTGEDRFRREVIGSPVFTTLAGDREFFEEMAARKVTPVEGDAARANLNLGDEIFAKIVEQADVVINTAGNVEFNPPLDMSINANTMCTKNVLDFVEETKCKKYVHISTCYVADRSIHGDSSPERIVSDRVITPEGNEILLDPEREIVDSLAAVERIKKDMESPSRFDDYRDRARIELEKMGRGDSARLVDKIAKNIRTFEIREELIKEGRKRGGRLNRPNVYTYTKTLAELLVKSRKDKIDYTIVRPSIVETTYRLPFKGWNEGVQGSAPLIFLMYKGHRFIPSLSNNERERSDAFLDLIPVDMVAAGTLLAAAALIEKEHKEIYQIAAGESARDLTITRVLDISQMALRDKIKEEEKGLMRWAKLNLQAQTVHKKTFDRVSSPRMLKMLSSAKERMEKFDQDRLPPAGSRLFQKMQGNLDRAYNMSQLKNKIFGEFLPFINHGYPVFQNNNGLELFRRLSAEEKEIFEFNPPGIDFLDYLSKNHSEAIVKWIFPILQKRINAINKVSTPQSDSSKEAKGEKKGGLFAGDEFSLRSFQMLFSGNRDDFREQFRLLRDSVRRNISKSARKKDDTPAIFYDKHEYVLEHLRRLDRGHAVSNFADADDELLKRIGDHFELVSGVRVDAERLRQLGSPEKLKQHIARRDKVDESAPPRSRLTARLPKEGLDVPEWAAKPIDQACYNLQMWFYKSVMNVKIQGKENIPLNNNNVVVIANHSSHLDYGLVWYALGEYAREMGILAARDYFFSNFWNSTFFRNFHNLIPIERNDNNNSYAAALVNAFSFMERGGPLLIFPEGTRSADGRMKPFKQGLGYLVEKTGADILPIKLVGTNRALPKGSNSLKSRDVRVSIGKVIPFTELVKDTAELSPTKTYYKITKDLQDSVTGLH